MVSSSRKLFTVGVERDPIVEYTKNRTEVLLPSQFE